MVYKEHLIELYVNGKKVELENQKSLNLRFNTVLLDPTKVSSSQAEYSFQFDIPMTPKNNQIFDYANNLGKLNKFHQRYQAEVYADGTLIFNGSVKINGFKDNMYNVNLVSVKVFSIEEIFGDSMLKDITWEVPFSGVTTINSVNAMADTNVFYPLVGYGVFQKRPYYRDEVANEYTEKHVLDWYNMWYVEDFYPSVNILETLKRCFEYKGYRVGGDAFQDPYLNHLFQSVNLAQDQSPDYNVGNPVFGHVDISATINTANKGVGYQQDLTYPYFYVTARYQGDGGEPEDGYNFNAIDIYNILASGNTPTMYQSPCYMYQPNEHTIIIPADGFYKIEMTAYSTLNSTNPFTAMTMTRDMYGEELHETDVRLTPDLREITPIEVHLVRNYDDNCELIKGKWNVQYLDGNPTHTVAYETDGGPIPSRIYVNRQEWMTCYPHEDPYNSKLPTDKGDFVFQNTKSRLGGKRTTSSENPNSDDNYNSGNEDTSQSGNFSGRRGGTRGGTIDMTGGGRDWSATDYGYVNGNPSDTKEGMIMAYDQAVSESFICGFSSMGEGTVSVMKNGYSWSKSNSTKNEAFYPEVGYYHIYREQGSSATTSAASTFNSNVYINTPVSRISVNQTTMSGYCSCMVYLNKNDILELFAIQREYHTEIGNDVTYGTTTNVRLKLTAFSPQSYDILKKNHNGRYDAPIEFPTQLQLQNFFNQETKMSDWAKNVIDAFNLDVKQYGKTVTVDTKKKLAKEFATAIDIDDRVNKDEVEAKAINYPRSMSIKFKIDEDEWGFERSAVKAYGSEAVLDLPDWKKYADSGYTVIELNDDTYETSTSDKNLQFSHCWWDTFYWSATTNSFSSDTSVMAQVITLPVISKYSYMIEGYSYDESMKHDGYGQPLRFWFRNGGVEPVQPFQVQPYVWTRTYPAEKAYVYSPSYGYSITS